MVTVRGRISPLRCHPHRASCATFLSGDCCMRPVALAALGALIIAGTSSGALAQSSAPAAPAKAAPAQAAPAAAPGRRCMRLPLSDIAVGRAETIAQAQLRLAEYSVAEAKRRGWPTTLVKSAETVQCEDYLYLPLIGQEYKCLVTATFCVK